MNADMSRIGGNHAFALSENKVQHGCIRLCAADKEKHFPVFTLTGFFDLPLCAFGNFVKAVRNRLIVIRFHKAFQNIGMRAFQIIAVQSDHNKFTLLIDDISHLSLLFT